MTSTRTQRELAVDYFNAAWDLIDQDQRTAEQDRQMLQYSFASRQLWGEIGGSVEVVTGDWQIGHVASLIGYSDLALDFANAAYERAISTDVPRWLVASTCEGLARAHAAAAHDDERDVWVAKAREHLAAVEDDEDREQIEAQLATVPGV